MLINTGFIAIFICPKIRPFYAFCRYIYPIFLKIALYGPVNGLF